jgi:hypothetical protein
VAARSAAETVAGQIFSVEYDGIEYGGLPVSGNDYVIGRRNGLITSQLVTNWTTLYQHSHTVD